MEDRSEELSESSSQEQKQRVRKKDQREELRKFNKARNDFKIFTESVESKEWLARETKPRKNIY